MNGARIIQLTSPSSMPEAVSFEQAFGEFSSASGAERRARRKARKLDRMQNRTEIKSARRAEKAERRSDRIAARQGVRADRIAGRTELAQARKAKRLSKREMGTESRLARRTARADVRAYKRSLRNPQEVPTTESAGYLNEGAVTEQGFAPTNTQSAGYAPQTQSGGYAPSTTSGGYAPSTESGYYEDEMPSTQSGYYENEMPSTGSGYYEGGDVYDQSLVDETAQNAYELGYQDAQQDTGLDVEITGEEDYGDFDGVMGAEDRFNELQDKNDMPVNPQIQAIADKCVWNEMLITKLKSDRKNATGNPQMISKTILSRTKRMKDLKNELEDYANYCGAYSNAEGTNEMIAQRKRIVQYAMNKARRKSTGQGPVNLTSVPRGLNPKISKNRIVVNSSETMSNVSGTGITALDNLNDYDAPDTREFFIPADGGFTKGIDLGSIALGALITVGFIYFNNKYKWIKM